MSGHLKQRIQDEARQLGFDLVGVGPAVPGEESQPFQAWLDAGYDAGMAYLRRDPEVRIFPRSLAPGVQSILAVAMNYRAPGPLSIEPRRPGQAWIARYAWGDDYHEAAQVPLRRLAGTIERLAEAPARICIDTAPILDRACAWRAGLGWFGRNTCIIHPELGSFLFLGEILTSLKLESDAPQTDRCGTCSACIQACPTKALVRPRVLDSRRCISYWTIEHRGPIPESVRPQLGTHVFGCDVCQEVCPWNRRPPRTPRPEYQPQPGRVAPDLARILEMSPDDFRRSFRRSPVRRAKYAGFLRNAAVAAGNSGDPGLISSLRKAAAADPLVAEHAEWAIRRLEEPTPAGPDADTTTGSGDACGS
jgi:epoxyqueuosine reductase